jgi:hypothetical protein
MLKQGKKHLRCSLPKLDEQGRPRAKPDQARGAGPGTGAVACGVRGQWRSPAADAANGKAEGAVAGAVNSGGARWPARRKARQGAMADAAEGVTEGEAAGTTEGGVRWRAKAAAACGGEQRHKDK